jgi:hypothetical protein
MQTLLVIPDAELLCPRGRGNFSNGTMTVGEVSADKGGFNFAEGPIA